MKENNKVLSSLDDHVAQLFGQVLYATENPRRRLILEAFNGHKTNSSKGIQRYLKEKDVISDARGYSKSKIRKNHLIPLVEARMLEEREDNLFEITSLGRDVKKIISGVKEFAALPIATHQELYPERVFLALRKSKQTYSELKSKLNHPTPRQFIKRLTKTGFIRVNHPCGSLHASSFSRFTISFYYPFIQGVKAYLEGTDRSWFTEYSIIHYLGSQWKEKFGKSIDLEEIGKLFEKGVETGDLIIKDDGSYKASVIKDPIGRLKPPGLKILALIQEGYDYVQTIAEESRLPRVSIYKILERLRKKNLIEEHKE